MRGLLGQNRYHLLRSEFDLGEKERLGIIRAEKQAMKAFESNNAEAFSLLIEPCAFKGCVFVSSLSAKSKAARDAEVLREGQTVVGHPTPDYRHAQTRIRFGRTS